MTTENEDGFGIIPLAGGWGLRVLEDSTIELVKNIGDQFYAMELGVSTIPPSSDIREGINWIRSGGLSGNLPH